MQQAWQCFLSQFWTTEPITCFQGSDWLKKFEHFKFSWMKAFWHPLQDPAVILGSRHILQNQKQHKKLMCHTDQTAATLSTIATWHCPIQFIPSTMSWLRSWPRKNSQIEVELEGSSQEGRAGIDRYQNSSLARRKVWDNQQQMQTRRIQVMRGCTEQIPVRLRSWDFESWCGRRSEHEKWKETF